MTRRVGPSARNASSHAEQHAKRAFTRLLRLEVGHSPVVRPGNRSEVRKEVQTLVVGDPRKLGDARQPFELFASVVEIGSHPTELLDHRVQRRVRMQR